MKSPSPIPSFLRDFLKQFSLFLERLGRPPLLLAALGLGILAQRTLTPQPVLAGVGLAAVGALYLLHTLSSQKGFREKAVFAIILAAFVAFLFQTPAYFQAPALFAFSAFLFLATFTSEEKAVDEPYSHGELLLLGVILVLGFMLLVYDLEKIPPGMHGDEGEAGMQALAILQGQVRNIISVGWYDQPLLGFIWPAVSMAIFGDTLFGLRLSSALVGIASLVSTYLLVRLIFGRRVALLASGLMAIGHWFIALNRLGINYTQTTLLETTALYFLLRGIRSRKASDWLLSGMLVGGGLYLYYASRLVPILVAAFLLILSLREQNFWKEHRRGILILFLAATLVFLPQGLYFLGHPKQFLSRSQFVFLFSSEQATRHFTGTADPVSALLVQSQRLLALFNYGMDHSGQYGYKGPLLDFISAILFILGLGYSLFHIRQPRYLLLVLWFWITLIVGGIFTLPAPFTPRLVGMIAVVYILVALALDKTLHQASKLFTGRGRQRVAFTLITATMAIIGYSNYQIYFVDYIHSLDGWAQLEPATAVAQYIQERREEHYFYLLGIPRLYLRHGTIRFLARNYEGVDVQNPEAYIPLPQAPRKDVSFILLPEYLEYLPRLAEYYPQGKEQIYLRSDDQIWFVAYEIPRGSLPQALPQK